MIHAGFTQDAIDQQLNDDNKREIIFKLFFHSSDSNKHFSHVRSFVFVSVSAPFACFVMSAVLHVCYSQMLDKKFKLNNNLHTT